MEALIEKIPSEYIGGVEYHMAPINIFHFMANDNLADIIKKSLNNSDFFLAQDVGLLLENNDIVYPDLSVYQKPLNYTDSGLITDIPLFVTEILSPSTRKKDMTVKKELYAQIGVFEYWIISPRDKAVEAYKLSDGKYELDNVYTCFSPEEWVIKSPEEKEEHPHITKIESIHVSVDIWDIFRIND